MADHEIIGEVAEAPQIENEYVVRLLVVGGFDDLFQYGFQRATSSEYNRWR